MVRDNTGRKVIGVGLACLDQLIMWQDMKAPVAANRILNFEVQGGGMTGTALVAVSRLGGRAEFWGGVGTDWMGGMILKGLADEGVDTSQVRRIEGVRGPMVVVCVDKPTGERYFLYSIGITLRDLEVGALERLKDAGCLLVDFTIHRSAIRAAAEMGKLKLPVVGDLGGGLGDSARELLLHVDQGLRGPPCDRAEARGDNPGKPWARGVKR